MIAVSDNSLVRQLCRSKQLASGICQLVNVRGRQLSIFFSWLKMTLAGTMLGTFESLAFIALFQESSSSHQVFVVWNLMPSWSDTDTTLIFLESPRKNSKKHNTDISVPLWAHFVLLLQGLATFSLWLPSTTFQDSRFGCKYPISKDVTCVSRGSEPIQWT